jgi:crotonobetainyl-CoA:carnitine CoA-transferase CaiB-like acyl-CoA transferase
VPSGPINSMDKVFADRQVRHREIQMSLPHARGIDVPTLRSPLRFSATPVQYASPPMLGQDTDAALAELLGTSAEELQSLHASGVL